MRTCIPTSILSRTVATLFPLIVFGASGCATTVHGTTQKVSITSNPPGATGLIEPLGLKIVTPAKVELRRKQNYTVHLEQDGYEPQNAYLYRVISPAMHGNLLLGGIVGLTTDLENGAAFELTPDPLEVTLAPDPQRPSTDAAAHASEEAEPPTTAAGSPP
jgi:hypothetical protein